VVTLIAKINFYEFLMATLWTSYAHRSQKVECNLPSYPRIVAYKVFDAFGTNEMAFEEMYEGLKWTLKGIGKVRGIKIPKAKELQIVAYKAFVSADASNDNNIDYPEFVNWMELNKLWIDFLNDYGTALTASILRASHSDLLRQDPLRAVPQDRRPQLRGETTRHFYQFKQAAPVPDPILLAPPNLFPLQQAGASRIRDGLAFIAPFAHKKKNPWPSRSRRFQNSAPQEEQLLRSLAAPVPSPSNPFSADQFLGEEKTNSSGPRQAAPSHS